jgi:shikimate dehydrogenase
VLILGAGGAARAAAAACAGFGARLRIIARRPQQTSQVFETCEVYPWTPLGFLEASDGCALILNTTPVGMASLTPSPGHPVTASPWPADVPFPPDAFVYDLVYNPPETAFVRQARAAGLRAAAGLGMLVEQGALAFELWTGRTAPRDLMRRTIAACHLPAQDAGAG